MNDRTLELAVQIADDAARGVLLMESRPAVDGSGWIDISAVPLEAEPNFREALEYLDRRGLLFYKEGSTTLVRLSEPGLLN